MKKIYYMLLALPLFLQSCNDIVDYENGYTSADKRSNTGAPVITGIYEVGDTAFATPLTSAATGQAVCIAGQNLNNLRSLKFNTIEADVTQAYTAWNKAVVYVPETFILTHHDKVEYTTDMGTAVFSFVVNPADLQLDGLLNEFCLAGTTATVAGQYFQTYGFGTADTSVTLDGQPLQVSDVTDESMSIAIPSDADDNSVITFTWKDDQGATQTKNVSFRPRSRLIFSDISTVQRDKESELATFETDYDIGSTQSALGTRHIHIKGQLEQWSNTELAFSQPMPDLGDLTNTDDFWLAFEVMTADDTYIPSSTSTECDGFQVRWGWNGDLCEWNPGNEGLNTHGQWRTVRLNLSEVAPYGVTATGDWSTIYINYKPIVECYVDFRIGNFRIERKSSVQEPRPPLRIDGLRNEFCSAGDLITVTGSGFKSYKFGTAATSVTMNGTALAVTNVADESVTIQVPANAADNSEIVFNWTDKERVTHTRSIWFRPTAGCLFGDISAATRDKDNAAVTYGTDADIATAQGSLGTTHLHYQGSLDAWAWVETAYSQPMPDLGSLAGLTDLTDYWLAFEVMTEQGTCIPNTYLIRWGWNGDMCAWQPNRLDTGGLWQTVRLDLEKVAPMGMSQTGEWSTLHIVFQPNEACNVNFRIGNFRIEKK